MTLTSWLKYDLDIKKFCFMLTYVNIREKIFLIYANVMLIIVNIREKKTFLKYFNLCLCYAYFMLIY